MSEIFFGELGLPEPELNLGVGSGSHAVQTADLMVALEKVLGELSPSRVVVYGDINSTLAASVVAAKLHIPVAHVEAGLRSFDRSMPEEINRIVTDAISDMHFVTSPEAMAHLATEGRPESGMYFVGNPMIDTLLRFRDRLDIAGTADRFRVSGRYGVATLHRPSNVDNPRVAAGLVKALAGVASQVPLIIPLHPRGRQTLTEAGLGAVPGIEVVDPIGYLDFMALMAGSSLVLTDSGGIQEETTILGIPCLTLRENTERPITVTMGTNRLVGSDPDRIVKAATQALASPRSSVSPPLWDGKAGGRIADVLSEP
jgi:UDP-N-acetylglucosamine 2-epimerase (non-hydrolysing)